MARQLSLEGIEFTWASQIDPDRDASGRPIELMPQARYSNVASLPLNPHGEGPFCKLRIPGLPKSPGVYAVTVDGDVVYVGEGQNLNQRWGSGGYGTISPRNCFDKGQPTNCKVNHRVLVAAKANKTAELWIFETDHYKSVEARLIRSLDPPWNSQVRWGLPGRDSGSLRRAGRAQKEGTQWPTTNQS